MKRVKKAKTAVIQSMIMTAGALMALATATSYAQEQKEAIEEVKMVRLEVSVLEWTLDTSLDYGFAVDYEKTPNLESELESGDLTLPPPSIPDQGIRLFLDNFQWQDATVEVVIEALEQVGRVRQVYQGFSTCEVKDLTGEFKGQDSKGKFSGKSYSVESGIYSASVHNGQSLPSEEGRPQGDGFVRNTVFQNVGFQLNFTPLTVVADDYIIMDLHILQNNRVDSIAIALDQNNQPINSYSTQKRELENTVIIKDEQLAIIGVMKSKTITAKESGIPWLARIPILGYLFKSRSSDTFSREIVFLIRPIIIDYKVDTPNKTAAE